jgi:large subunit ribosomal protein L4
MSIKVIDNNGKVLEELKIDSEKTSENLSNSLYLLKNYQNHQARQKSASCKTRGQVRGGGAKPYKQKGTGRARRGTNRTPLRVGGGVVFGPRPIKRHMKANKKFIHNVIVEALMANQEKIKFIKTDKITTKAAKSLVQDENKRILLLVGEENQILIKAFRNLRNCVINNPKHIKAEEIINASDIFIDYNEKAILEGVK